MCKQFRENVLKNVQVDIFHSKMSRTAIIHHDVRSGYYLHLSYCMLHGWQVNTTSRNSK